jgi:antitoxin HigA-1
MNGFAVAQAEAEIRGYNRSCTAPFESPGCTSLHQRYAGGFGGYHSMATNPLLKGLQPMHPGEMLREDVLPSLGKSKTEIAGLLGISRQTLFDILRERQPVTPAMALRFGKLLGNGPDVWIDLQRAYDLHVAEKQLGKVLAKIPTITAA